MASKQLGKLRQWAGEVISSRDKTTFTDEFRDLETDIDLRREGATRLLAASEAYLQFMSKKKESEALNDDAKILPIDAFGVVMLVHGEDFGEDSLYGTSLVKMGRAHCKVATIQEAYVLTFQDTFIASLQKFIERIKEYDQQRKKLDSRRLTYDAAVAKFEKLKGGKKEKEKKEAEEEMGRARERFEDTEEEVRGQMHEIQEEEISQHRQLSNLLDIEMNYVNQYLEVLRDVKLEWNDDAAVGHKARPQSREPSLLRSKSRSNSVRSKKSARSGGGHGSDDSPETEDIQRTLKRRPSKSESVASRPPSRPVSRLSMRKRADSNAAPSDKETDKEKSEGSKSEKSAGRRLSVTGWASSAVGLASLGKKNKDKDNFAALQENENGDGHETLKRSTSTHSMGGIISQIRNKTRDTPVSSPKAAPRILKPLSLQEKKVVRALYDFSGASDELAFKAGDEILVINEVLDDWWMGEINGKTGLFPTGYVEVVASRKPTAPVMAPKNSRSGSFNSTKKARRPSEDQLNREDSMDGYNHSSDGGDDDNDFTAPPVTPRHSPFYGVPSDAADAASIASSNADDDPHFQTSRNLATVMVGAKKSAPVPIPQPVSRSTTTDTTSSIGTKKAPPPPPPRRAITNPGIPPAVPDRPLRPIVTRSLSISSGSVKTSSTPPSSVEGRDYDVSPFDSASELTNGTNTTTASANGCTGFKQNPFKPKGMCNNCFNYH